MALQAEAGACTQSETDSARLAHKRALDRKSQNAKRERTKLLIQSLEQQLASSEGSVRHLRRENERLEAENIRLRGELASVPSSSSPLDLDCDGVSDEGCTISTSSIPLQG